VQTAHAANGAPAHAFPHGFRIDAGFDTQSQPFGNGLANAVADHIVHQLTHGARPDRAGIKDFIPE
jgi:hypothetical protein